MIPKSRFAVIGPSAEKFRGGIALFSSQLTDALSQIAPAELWEWKRPYPNLIKQRSAPSSERPELDVLSPRSWENVSDALRSAEYEAIFLNWVHPIQTLPIRKIVRALRGKNVWVICHNIRPHEAFPGWGFFVRQALAESSGLIVHSDGPYQEAKVIFPSLPIQKLFLPPLIREDGFPEDFKKKREVGRPLRLLFFGHIRPYKGLETLLEAFSLFEKKEPGSSLVIAGSPISGSLLPGAARRYGTKIATLIDSLGIKNSVELRTEYLSDAELRKFLCVADAAVFPFDSVSSSASIISALSIGTPVIASNLPGLSDYVIPGENGLLAKAGDAEGFARAFSELSQARFSAEKVASSVARFCWEEYARQLVHCAETRCKS